MSQVTIYTKTGCPFCAAAKEDMKRKGIQYTEINVNIKPEARADVTRLTKGQNIVPVIVEGDKVQVGFGGG
ncbi:MAG: glutaredoxin family protein [Chloroflexota bacterium]